MDGAQSAESAVMSPRVSVIMPVYNAMPYLREAIESILNQTFRDFEFIIVNDCSTDESWDVIQEYAARDARIVALTNAQNMSQAWSSNRALAVARGEYVAMQDADDVSLPHRLELQVKYLDENPDIRVMAATANVIDADGNLLTRRFFLPDPRIVEARLPLVCYLTHSTMMARRKLMNDLGGFSTDIPTSPDYDFWARSLAVTQISGLSETLVQYRNHSSESRISLVKRDLQKQTSRKIALVALKNLIGETPVDEEAFSRFRQVYQRFPHEILDVATLQKLTPLWEFLSEKPVYRREWGTYLLSLHFKHFKRRHFRVSFELMRICIRYFKIYQLQFSYHLWRKIRIKFNF